MNSEKKTVLNTWNKEYSKCCKSGNKIALYIKIGMVYSY